MAASGAAPRRRVELQASKESTGSLAARYGLNPKTVKKWRERTTTVDAPMGPKAPKSTVLTPAEEAIVVAFRQKTLLPLDDVLGCLKDTIPNLGRSALHRYLQRHGISRLPIEETAEKRKRFKTYEIGYVHIDSCELRHADGKLIMILAIDRRFQEQPAETGRRSRRPGSRLSAKPSCWPSGRLAGSLPALSSRGNTVARCSSRPTCRPGRGYAAPG
jgi:hypothetical protein